jgi:hypothetical protein
MAMPAHLEAWWREHPERWKQRHRHAHGFPADGTTGQQIDWFRRQFLKLADKVSSTNDRREAVKLKHQGEFLKLAFMATLKRQNEDDRDDVPQQYAEFRMRQDEKNGEARARREAPFMEPDETGAAILEYFKNTPYRTKDRNPPE